MSHRPLTNTSSLKIAAAYSITCKDRSEANPAYSTVHFRKSKAKQFLFIPQIGKDRSEGNYAYSRNEKDGSETKNS
jgi:hypothetical protein